MKLLMKRIYLLFVLPVFTIGCSENSNNTQTYDMSTVYEDVMDLNHLIYYSEVEEEPEAYVIIDVRDRKNFNEQHLEGAISIPRGEFLTTEWSDIMNDQEKTYAIYDNDYQSAHGAWLLLKTIIDDDVYILGDEEAEGDSYDGAKYEYASIMEEIRKDYEKAIEEERLLATKPKPVIQPVRKKKKVEEEEEGCS